MSKITPTIGRKLYFRPNGMPVGAAFIQNDQTQPLDATIVYVWPENVGVQNLNLFVIDHAGLAQAVHGIPLIQDGEKAPDAPQGYAEWMPFQVGQAKAQETEKVDPPNVMNAATQTPASSSDTSQPTEAATASVSPAVIASAETGPAPTFDFGGALAWLKAGKKVARSGWNGKGMFVYLVPPASYPVQTGAAKAYFGEGSMVPYNAYFAIKNVNNTVSTWVPSVNDCLGDDWFIID